MNIFKLQTFAVLKVFLDNLPVKIIGISMIYHFQSRFQFEKVLDRKKESTRSQSRPRLG
jgi:hypothetical protein